ncbi:MAG: hypothetical protein E7053_08920 [Lentisphaerae bacterium]|nr:hypothetical protein [Lentisphaerota bacterium]
MFIKNWQNPPAELRSKLFWAWNGELDEKIIRQQIAVLRDMGMGGFFMHSRNGLKTPYLGEKWFDIVRSAVDEANKQQIKAALYDEDRWPSGGAGGKVAALAPELAGSSLHCQVGGSAPENTIFSGTFRGKMHHFYVRRHPGSEWFNNSCFPDVFRPETAAIFLQLTHEKYLENLGSFAENSVDEIFMDEPFYGVETFRFGAGVPWSVILPEKYFQRFHEELPPQLPGLFFDLPDDSHVRIRWQFYSLISGLFRENFLRPVSEWCTAHGLKLTGHLLGEDLLATQAGSHGSNMAALQYFHQPGIDYLTNTRYLPATVKQLASAARQLGKSDRLAEIHGCTGWEFSLYDQRRSGDMLFALGVNRQCLHLGWYSAGGECKRDFPGSLAWHTAHHAEFSRLEDRSGRLHAIFAGCREVRDILVLDPVESAYTLLQQNYEDDFLLEPLENSRNAISDILLNANLDFDYGDEEIMSRYGSVSDGEMRVGEVAYKAVVIPETVTLRRTTLELLKKFAASGGKLFFAGKLPGYIEGEKLTGPLEFSRCLPEELPEKLAFCRRVSLTDKVGGQVPGLLHLLLRHERGYFLFIHNTGYSIDQQSDATNWRSVPFDQRNSDCGFLQVSVAGVTGVPQFWNMDDGSVSSGSDTFPLAAGESRMLFFPDEPEEKLPERAEYQAVELTGNSFDIELTENNVLLLDRAEAADESGEFQFPVDMRRLDAMLRRRYAMVPRGLPRRQPWAEESEGERVPVRLRFTFFCDEIPAGAVRFAVEDGGAEVFCNGVKLERSEYYWFDHSLKFFAVKNLVRGRNQIVLNTFINQRKTLEDCFLLGDFGVKIAGFELHLTAPVRKLAMGDWTEQGLPFYSGAVDYKVSVPPGKNRKLLLKIKGSFAAVLENGDRDWHERDDLRIPDGVDKVTLRVYGSRRNSHGPFHIVQQLRYCNPASFVPLREEFHPAWQLEPYGITDKKIK